jgi:hypothetical protein
VKIHWAGSTVSLDSGEEPWSADEPGSPDAPDPADVADLSDVDRGALGGTGGTTVGPEARVGVAVVLNVADADELPLPARRAVPPVLIAQPPTSTNAAIPTATADRAVAA